MTKHSSDRALGWLLHHWLRISWFWQIDTRIERLLICWWWQHLPGFVLQTSDSEWSHRHSLSLLPWMPDDSTQSTRRPWIVDSSSRSIVTYSWLHQSLMTVTSEARQHDHQMIRKSSQSLWFAVNLQAWSPFRWEKPSINIIPRLFSDCDSLNGCWCRQREKERNGQDWEVRFIDGDDDRTEWWSSSSSNMVKLRGGFGKKEANWSSNLRG